ncbi:MAG: DUF971 domain-containing protein [Planctomycetes bacterium]|nr:DUF971 domain-containing protein [Planctomycetota bacterium]
MNPANPAEQPLEIDLDRSKELRIKWADGHAGVLPLAELRRACPCATCRTAREERAKNPLHVIPADSDPMKMATARDAQLMGTYALRITWNDGHDTGIYNYGMLRALCGCESCRKSRTEADRA